MDDRPAPRFRLADIVLLVAATCLGLAMLRIIHEQNYLTEATYRKSPPGRMIVDSITVYSSPLLIAWTLFAVMYTVQCSWPSLRQAIAQPGFIACVVATVALIDTTIYFAVRVLTDHSVRPPISMYLFNASSRLTSEAGMLIAGAWLALGLAVREKPGSTWVECFGCLVGGAWLAVFLIQYAYFTVVQYFV